MEKKCLSCGMQFTLSGSGKRQKYCSKCSRRGDGRGRGLLASKPLKIKDAGRQIWTPIPPGPNRSPIQFTTPERNKGRIWSWEARIQIKGEEVFWRSAIAKAKKEAALAAKERQTNRSRFDKPVDLMGGAQRGPVGRKLRQTILDTGLPLPGFTVRLFLKDEAPQIGSGYRKVLCQFRGKSVVLHHAGHTQAIKREVFKELIAANKRYLIKAQRPQLKLVVSNPPKFDERVSDAA
jgi:hypothetical protein